jgi:hypothetical protein
MAIFGGPTTALRIRKKLYYDMVATRGTTIPFRVRFMAGTGANFGVDDDPDRYASLMAPNRFSGATGNTAKARQAIGAWLQCLSITASAVTPPQNLGGAFTVDFIEHSAALGAAAVDPAAVRRAAARIRTNGFVLTAGDVFRGTLYIQRQHTIEV